MKICIITQSNLNAYIFCGIKVRVSEVVKLRPDDIDTQRKDKHITIRTVQKIFENVCKKTGVTKEVTVHSLRHSLKLGGMNK